MYLCTELLFGFLFEAPITLRPLIDFFWIWLFIRYFMCTHASGQSTIGDLSPEFALSTFFPQRARPTVISISDGTYACMNMCGAVTHIRRWLEGRSSPQSADPDDPEMDPTHRRSSSEESLEEKKALESIDEEIKTIT